MWACVYLSVYPSIRACIDPLIHLSVYLPLYVTPIYIMYPSLSQVRGYIWVCIWFVIFCFDQLYIKYQISVVKVDSNWGRVFYTNLWSSLILLPMALYAEPHVLTNTRWKPETISALCISCAIGTAMSYFAFLCRAAVSATSFTIIGNVCKIVTVLINVSVWDKHASAEGLGCLLVCLGAAAAYQQAPLREEVLEGRERLLHGTGIGVEADSEEQKRLTNEEGGEEGGEEGSGSLSIPV